MSNHIDRHCSQCYFVHRQCSTIVNNASYNKAHTLIGKPYLAIIASNRGDGQGLLNPPMTIQKRFLLHVNSHPVNTIKTKKSISSAISNFFILKEQELLFVAKKLIGRKHGNLEVWNLRVTFRFYILIAVSGIRVFPKLPKYKVAISVNRFFPFIFLVKCIIVPFKFG